MTFFGDEIASGYDEAVSERFDPTVIDPTVDFLVDLAGDGPVLEFATGTGRVALPLSRRGIEVHGIEFSQPMHDQMLAKPGGQAVQVTLGDMATTRVDGGFSLVYLVFNTITNLLTQDQQVQCFENAAAHLVSGGHFVIEQNVPPVQRLNPGETFLPFDIRPGHVGVNEIDTATQISISHHYYPTSSGTQTVSTTHRYAWPAEYDLMARIAGLTLSNRYADFKRNPFTKDSPAHVSVWTKP